MCILKTVTRVAVVGGLIAGAALLVAGPQRVGAMAAQIRASVNERIDKHIDDPVVARQQLERLAAQYPQQLATFRNELNSLREQIGAFERERAVSQRVVSMAQGDLEPLQDRLSRAEHARDDHPYATISVSFNNRELTLDEAYAKATQMQQTVRLHETRVHHADDALAHLREQEATINDIIEQLEAEHAQFQAQLWQIESELELLAQQEKLVKMVERRQSAIDGYERYDAGNLDGLVQRIDSMRADQEARLKVATRRVKTTSYEDRARAMLNSERAAKETYERTLELSAPVVDVDEIVIDGEDTDEDDDEDDPSPVAQLLIN